MNLHEHNEFQRAQWEAYQARQDVSLIERVMASPVTFGVCLAALCAAPVVIVVLLLR